MIKNHIKYYLLLIAFITSIAYVTMSYSDSTTPNSQAYDTLNDAEASAKQANDDSDKTRKDNPSDYLHQIADNTYAFLKAFNYFSLNWLQIYTAPTSNELDAQFGNYLLSYQDNLQYQLALLTGGSFNLLDQNGKPKQPAETIQVDSIYPLQDENLGIYPTAPPTANMNYISLVNNSMTQVKPTIPVATDFKNAQYFVKNASGINIHHPILRSVKDKRSDNYLKYITFINSIKSIASFNAYILNEQLADSRNNFKLNTAQMELKRKASNTNWLNHVNTEMSLGVILRQILLFNSQNYVLMSDLLTTQKQLLAATAMTNTLIIASSGFYEKTLYDAAR